MKITNKTHWDSTQLRKIAHRVADEEALLTKEGKKRLRVFFEYKTSRTGWCYGGYGTYGSGDRPGRAWVKLPRERHAVEKLDVVQVAKIIAHEIGHAVGLSHADMNGLTKYTWVEGWREKYAWAEQFPVEPKPVKVSKRKDPSAERAKLEKMIQKWTRKQKFATTMLKKWQRKLARLEKKTAETARQK